MFILAVYVACLIGSLDIVGDHPLFMIGGANVWNIIAQKKLHPLSICMKL